MDPINGIILTVIITLAAIGAIGYLWLDAIREAKGAGRYAKNR